MSYAAAVENRNGVGSSIPEADAGTVPLLDRAFEGRCFLSMAELATLLEIDVKTLRRHVKKGHIVPTVLGLGLARPRRRFTKQQVEQFIRGRTATLVSPLRPELLAELHEQARLRAEIVLGGHQKGRRK